MFGSIAVSQIRYTVIDLGPGNALCINDSSQGLLRNSTHTYLWDAGTFTDLGAIAGYWVNNHGQVVGSFNVGNPAEDTHSFLWQSGVFIDISPGVHTAVALAINDAGTIVGRADIPQTAVYWSDTTPTDLGVGADFSQAHAINKKGSIVGIETTSGITSAFVADSSGIHDIGPISLDTAANAMAINDNDMIVGSLGIAGNVASHGVLWKNGSMVDLFPGLNSAYGVNNAGENVGTLFKGVKPAGSFSVSWNGDNYPSGVYLCRMKAGDVTLTRKLLLMK